MMARSMSASVIISKPPRPRCGEFGLIEDALDLGVEVWARIFEDVMHFVFVVSLIKN